MKTHTPTEFMAFAVEALAAIILAMASPTAMAAAQDCTSMAAYNSVGPALTVKDVEALSLKKLKETPYAPQIPFGYQNDRWLAIKAAVKPGDTLHAFKTDVTGGYLVLRGKCVVDQIVSWIR